MTPEDRLATLKELLGVTDYAQDGLLTFVIEAVLDRVLSYINHEVLPEPLENVLLLMCTAYYKGAGLGSAEVAQGPVTAVKRGDVSTSFGASAGAGTTAQTFNLDAMGEDFFGWRSVLNEYRRLRW